MVHKYGLRFEQGPNTGTLAELNPLTLNLVSRGDDNFIRIKDTQVSKWQCVVFKEKRSYALRDLFSKNGTYLNGEEVNEDVLLAHDDIIGIGDRVRLRFVELPDSDLEKEVGLTEKTPYAGTKFVTVYLADPLKAIREENERLGTQATAQDLDSALGFHKAIDCAYFPYRSQKDEEHYKELSCIDFLRINDYLPGSHFVLGKPRTWDREKLRIAARKDSLIHKAILEAKRIGIRYMDNQEKSVEIIYELFRRLFPSKENIGFKPGSTMLMEDSTKKGGCCRHRAGTLQWAYQEAAIPSVYVRGGVYGSENYHAFVMIDLDRDGKFELCADPSIRTGFADDSDLDITHCITSSTIPIPGVFGKIENFELQEDQMARFGIEDVKEHCYYYNPEKFNVIWRRKMQFQKTL